jgi:D-alanine-D-alanine ligase
MPLAEVDYSELPTEIPPIMSYAAKCMENTEEYKKTSVICPAVVEQDLAREIVSTSLRAFRAVGAWGYGRVDVRLDSDGRPCILEVNCNACLEDGYGLARQAASAGITYPRLLQMIVKAALEGMPFDADVPMA